MLSSKPRLPGHRHRCSTNATVVSARSPEYSGRTSEQRRAMAGGVSAVWAAALAATTASAPAAAAARAKNENAARSRRFVGTRVLMSKASAGSARDAVLAQRRERDTGEVVAHG